MAEQQLDKLGAGDRYLARADTKVTRAQSVNRRKSIRFIRNDLGATIQKISLFNFNFWFDRGVNVKLLDISSRGVLIASEMRLATGKRILLTIRFPDFTEFEIEGIIVRKDLGNLQAYGIKFDYPDDELADYLVSTQRRLIFK